MPPSRRGRLERTPTRAPSPWSARRHVMARPVSADELAGQLRTLLPHDAQCRWTTHPRRRADQTLAQTEVAVCSCTAVPDRAHVVDLLLASAAGELTTAVVATAAAGPLGGLRS